VNSIKEENDGVDFMGLQFKPDLEDASKHWEAYFSGDIIKRPLVCVTAPKPGMPHDYVWYKDVCYQDSDIVIDRFHDIMMNTYWGGDAIPHTYLTLGPDEIAASCGSELLFTEGMESNTNWSRPIIKDPDDYLKISLDKESLTWKRIIELYEKAAVKFKDKAIVSMPDLHSNMDILMALRGTENLCFDLIDIPEIIDEAMLRAHAVFIELWEILRQKGNMEQSGYCQLAYSPEGAAVLQCDFSCMMSVDMFDRWVLPALEEEAAIAKHVVYHWDGPQAKTHENSLVNSELIQTLQYVPGAGQGSHLDNVDFLRHLQDRGKNVQVWASPDEARELHKTLVPDKTLYVVTAATPDEADALIEWFEKNT